MKEESRGECSRTNEKKKFWNTVWGLNLPNKVKLFLWRAIIDILPCSLNLQRRKINGTAQCIRCGAMEESALHALSECSFSKKVWKVSLWMKSGKHHNSFLHWLEHIIHTNPLEQVEVFVVICWQLWNERNSSWHGKVTCKNPYLIIQQAHHIIEEFSAANHKHIEPKVNRSCTWSTPAFGRYKLNSDGASENNGERRGLGAVIRNEFGQLMGANAHPIRGHFSPLVTELLALKTGICFALEVGIIPLDIEVDSKEVARLVNSVELCWSEEGTLVEDIKNLMHACGTDKVVFQPRECNMVAHGLAKSILYENASLYYIEEGPEWLMKSIESDLLNCNLSSH